MTNSLWYDTLVTMHILPAYFTTTNTRKRKKSKKPASLIEAERQHAKFLKKMGYIGDKCSGSTASSNLARVGSTPTSPATNQLPLSDDIPIGVAPKKELIPHNFTIAPAYNKGPYQVISKSNIKDIGR